MKPSKMSAVILAGGRSSRMGENKLLLPLGSRTVIGHLIHTLKQLFAEVIVVTDTPSLYRPFPVRVACDLIRSQQKNSLTGIHAGLTAAKHEYCMVVAGDMPFVMDDVISSLCGKCDGFDITIPREGEYFQPLCAVYHKNCLPHIEKMLAAGRYKIAGFFPNVRTHCVDTAELAFFDPDQISFFNVNTPQDYQRALAMLADAGGKEELKMSTIPLVSIVGKSGSGKTTLLCGLIPELKKRGYKVATIKHDVHGFDIDKPGKDTWKHAQAGADTVVISSPWKVAMIEKVTEELTMDQVIEKISGVDIILTEGYKRNNKPKIEIFRSTVHDAPLCLHDDNLLAIASDVRPDLGVPIVKTDDYAAMADIIEAYIRKKPV